MLFANCKPAWAMFIGIDLLVAILSISLTSFFVMGCSDQTAVEKQIDMEFRNAIKDSIFVKEIDFFIIGGLIIGNGTDFDWDRAELILNPPIPTTSALEGASKLAALKAAVKAAYMMGTDDVPGFRAPPDSSKMYGPVNRGASINVTWGDFVNKDTREKFSTTRYAPSSVLLTIFSSYKGAVRKAAYIGFERKSDGNWSRWGD